MNIEIRFEPKTPPMSWKDFQREKPPYSIAGDGYVNNSTIVDLHAKQANLDHHVNCIRSDTDTTAQQMYTRIGQGLFKYHFRDEDGPRAILFFNDNDQDVCLAAHLAENHHNVQRTPVLNRLLNSCGEFDKFAGFVKGISKDTPILGEMNWIFKPYTDFRSSGGLYRQVASDYESVYRDVSTRIGQHLLGRGQSISPDSKYETLRNEQGWTMVNEIGPQARLAIADDGIEAFVSVKERGDGSFHYVIFKNGELHPLPLPKILRELQKAEGGDENDQWGGNPELVIGSPRTRGSQLSPDDIAKIINDVCKAESQPKQRKTRKSA